MSVLVVESCVGLFTSTVAVCSKRDDLPGPQPNARGSGY